MNDSANSVTTLRHCVVASAMSETVDSSRCRVVASLVCPMKKMRPTLLFFVALCVLLLTTHTADARVHGYVARPFRAYYYQYEGSRVLGAPRTGLLALNSYAVQFFEKGSLEDHSSETSDLLWRVMYGRLTIDLITLAPHLPINMTHTTYGDIALYTRDLRPAPGSVASGPVFTDGGMYVPYDPHLHAAYGYIVPVYFWDYINRADLFPGGWLHDVGLPISNSFATTAMKQGESRMIVMQPFERAVLTYDALNPEEWQVERANIGDDFLQATGIHTMAATARSIEIRLAEQWLYAYEDDELVYDAPVSTGKPGFDTPVGSFAIYRKLPVQTMKGRLKGETWNVPDVPYVMYFYGGDALHGTYWHNSFGTGARLSHGCVNLSVHDARVLYEWAPIGTPVWVHW